MGKLLVIAFVLGLSLQTQAALFNRGTDSLGNQLIYDSDLNITWYDYTHSAADASDQSQWALGLSVTLGENVYSGWRLPATLPVNGIAYQYTLSYNGSTDLGFNITSPNSEMAYLYYVELENKGYYDTSGNIQAGWGLSNTGLFSELHQGSYWSYNPCPQCPGGVWGFDFYGGGQATYGEGINEFNLAIAVRSGDVAPVPIPSGIWLFGSGLAIVWGRIAWGRCRTSNLCH